MDKKSRLKEELRLTKAGEYFFKMAENINKIVPINVNDNAKPYKKVNVIPIPDGSTNGDMIKAMFHNCECSVHEYMGIKCGIDVKIYFYENQYFTVWFPTNWWNAPYKKEVVE